MHIKQPAATHARAGLGTARTRRLLWHIPLLLVAAITVVPFYAMVVISLRPGQIVRMPEALIPHGLSLGAYQDALRSNDILAWVVNSTVYSLASVVLVLLFASMAGYAFAKKRFLGRDMLFWVFLTMLMVPGQLTLIPQFLMITSMRGLDTMWGLIVPTLANAQAMFLMKQFMEDIPDELISAARIDGAGEFRTYWSVILPQTKPILATLGTFVFLWHWNDFLWPLVMMRTPSNYVLTVGLNAMQAKEPALATIMASATITFVPALIVFIVLQRFFVRGVMMSGLK
uniref:carbohydrate ABC transporter permease n=1 Tax=Tessaracoccus timonensis TaxID=2161816 RepID=UPI000D5603AC|nr:carbohydrate ABC transporter permease [Tessaracoccus timonensis]